ncbi:TonB-dependent receptor [Henriciella sp.]|uniref:TonB-dependent receptor n=1 Tax=Henriciella sp. TaxID=1968823 RepID=UPI002604C0E7|nr:TonB-dependent receptor [Henriciella sp.]
MTDLHPACASRLRLRDGIALTALALAASQFIAMPAQAQTEIAGEASVGGRVGDVRGNAYFRGAEVILVELGRRTTTGQGGRYSFSSVPPGTYTVEVQYLGAGTTRQTVQVSGSEPVRLDFAIGTDASIMDNVLVVGQRASYTDALNRKRNADNILSGVSSDFIGQFPDQNVTEAAQRIPGVAINRDQGEGRFISIRGASPNLNSVSINGISITSAESDQRQVALDVIPSELVSNLTVTKSLTPDMEGDAIGGAVDIESASAFERAGLGGKLTAQTSYNDLRDEFSPRFSGSASNVFSAGSMGEIGVLGSFSYYGRELGSDGVENGDGLDDFGGTAFPVVIEPRDYVLKRTRIGGALNIDWRVNSNHELYLRTLYSDFADDEVQGGTVYEADPDYGANVAAQSSDRLLLRDQEVESYVSEREETQTIWSVSTGGESRFGAATLEYQLAYSDADEDNPDYVEPVFVADFSDTGILIGTDLADVRRPEIITNNLEGFSDASRYELDEIVFEDSETEDTEWSGKLDLRYDTSFGRYNGFWKVGTKASLREKTSELDALVFGGADQGLTVADFLNPDIDYPLGLIAPQAQPRQVASFVRDNLDVFSEDLDEEGTFIDSNAEDFAINEDVYAGYAMASVDIDRLTLTGGLRVEHTEYDASGNEVTLDEVTGTLDLVPIEIEDSYTDVLPSLNARYALNEEMILRAAYFRAVVRPVFEQNRPATVIETDDEGEVEAEGGNTDLERYKADSIDLAFEYYPGDIGLISAGVFFKNIENPVFPADLAGTPGFEGFDEFATFVNGEDAQVYGFETAWQQELDFLAAPFDGFLLAANYTLVDTEASVPLPDGGQRDVELPFQSRHTANVSLGYEKYGITARAAVSYRDRILDEIGAPDDASEDVYINDHIQIDLTAAYQVNQTFQVFAEASNLNDRPLYSYAGTRNVNVQYEEYGPTYTFGLKATF